MDIEQQRQSSTCYLGENCNCDDDDTCGNEYLIEDIIGMLRHFDESLSSPTPLNTTTTK